MSWSFLRPNKLSIGIKGHETPAGTARALLYLSTLVHSQGLSHLPSTSINQRFISYLLSASNHCSCVAPINPSFMRCINLLFMRVAFIYHPSCIALIYCNDPLFMRRTCSLFIPRGSGQVYLSGSTCPQPADNTFRSPQIVRLVTIMRIGEQSTKAIQIDAHYVNLGEARSTRRHTFLNLQSSTG